MARAVKYNERKFSELVLYIAAKCQDHERFGATKLNKILFFSDFCSYLAREKPITGAVYQKLKWGPAPKHLLPVQTKLINTGAAAMQDNVRPGTSYVEKRLIALRRPNLGLFEAEEIAIVDEIIEKLEDDNAVDVSNRSHGFRGWELAAMNEEIPYFTVYLPRKQPALSDRDRAWVGKVARAFEARSA